MTVKKSLVTVFAAAAMSAAANTVVTQYFVEDWSCPDTAVLWEMTGSGKTPAGSAASLAGTDSWTLIEFPWGEAYMSSISTTEEGGRVNCRLVSPEIEIPHGGAVLSFDAANWNPDRNMDNKLSVYVVPAEEVGQYEEYEAAYSARISANNYPSPAHIGITLTDFDSSKVKIVFVNEGNDCGLLGIGNVTVAMYDACLNDVTPIYRTEREKARITATAGICTVATAFTAVLTVDDSECETLSVEIRDKSGYMVYPLSFNTEIEAGELGNHTYSISLTPQQNGAPELIHKGTLVFGGGFPAMIVEEEGTGEKCGNCPFGAAGLERFSDLYPDRFIGIAVHCTDVFSGMVMRAHGYSLQFEKNPANPIVSLPSALINRTVSLNPSNLPLLDQTVNELLTRESPLTVHVDKVDFDEVTGDMSVSFSALSCADLTGAALNAAVVLTADGLTGSGPEWTQANYLSGTERPDEVDDSWWEYLKFYYEYPSRHILSGDCQYNHVAMGIYPDFNGNGAPMPSEWRAGVRESMTISFRMPLQTETNGFGVQNVDNTAVTVLIMDNRTGEVLGASKVDAPLYNTDLSAVETIEVPSLSSERTVFYDLSGRMVDPLRCGRGIYIRRSGSDVRKIVINH